MVSNAEKRSRKIAWVDDLLLANIISLPGAVYVSFRTMVGSISILSRINDVKTV